MERWPERDKLVLEMLDYLIKNKVDMSEEEEQEYRDKILELYK